MLVTFVNSFSVFAVNIDDNNLGKYRIYCTEDTEHYIKYNDRVQINYVYYYLNENNETIPAYCLNLGVDGPETFDEYYVNVSEALEDETVTSILLNGYPYKTPYELGLPTDYQASYSTQFAIWAYLSNLDLNKIAATRPEYECVVSAIKNIYFNGIENKSNTNDLINMEIYTPEICKENSNVYSTRVKLDYNDENIYGYTLNVSGLKNYSILDNNTNMQIYPDSIYGYKDFNILVPREDIKEDTSVNITINYESRNASLMFGVADMAGMQNLVLTKNNRDVRSVSNNTNIKYVKNSFVIKKVDKDDKSKPISGVKFKIYNDEMKLLGEYVTNNDGIISFDFLKELDLKQGDKIIIEEISAPDNYYIDENNNKVELILKYDDINEVIIENEKATGTIDIIKKSLDYNPYTNVKKDSPLKGCEFEIYNENMELIEKIVSDENGHAKTSRLEVGKYYIKEVKTNDYYILDNKIHEINISEHNEVKEFVLYNKSMEKELPKTGF